MNKWILALMLVLAISVPSLAKDKDKDKDKDKSAGSNVEQQIKALDQQSRDAALKGDVTFLERRLADNYVAIGGNGSMSDRNQVIQNRKNGVNKFEAIDIRDQKIRVYGNTAIVEDDANVKGSMNGQPYSGEFRATFVWVKQGGDWKLVQFQATPVEAATSAATKK